MNDKIESLLTPTLPRIEGAPHKTGWYWLGMTVPYTDLNSKPYFVTVLSSTQGRSENKIALEGYSEPFPHRYFNWHCAIAEPEPVKKEVYSAPWRLTETARYFSIYDAVNNPIWSFEIDQLTAPAKAYKALQMVVQAVNYYDKAIVNAPKISDYHEKQNCRAQAARIYEY